MSCEPRHISNSIWNIFDVNPIDNLFGQLSGQLASNALETAPATDSTAEKS